MPATTDSSNCDREQIQFSGAIQPHGALLVLGETELRIQQASANSEAFLGLPPDALLGQGVARVLGKSASAELRERLAAHSLSAGLVHLMTVQPLAGTPACHLFGHRTADGHLLLEFDRLDEAARISAPDVYQSVHAALHRLQSAETLQAFFDHAVVEVRAITGFERVMAYRFAADGSGEVIAESLAAGLEPYLGLHYPAVDIPEPARRVCRLSWLRHLPDAGYHSVPLIPECHPETGAPVDLSRSFLRSVSRMYTGYLKNMGVKATLVTTLLKDGQLWGLISCMHHSAPRYLPFETRAAVECLAHMVSLLMGRKDAEDHYAYRLKLGEAREQLLDAMFQANAPHPALRAAEPNALSALDAEGVALLDKGELHRLGQTPAEADILALAEWLARRDGLWFASHELAEAYPPAASFQPLASGLLAVRWAPGSPDGLLWFRPEWRQVVHWAGDPNKPMEIDDSSGEARLMPRTSFELWKETVAGQSRPWLECEIEHAIELRHGIVDLILRHTEQLRRINRELAESNLELDTFAYAASHDLKEPLRGIHTSIEFLQEEDGPLLSSSGQGRLATVLRLTRRMDELIETLLQYSRVGRIDLRLEAVDLNELVVQTLELFEPLRKERATARMLGRLPVVECDRVRVGEIFTNLISNALKYNDREEKRVDIGCDASADPPVFFVRDNGIGIAVRQYARIFQIFRRLHPRDAYGGGTGAGLTITKKAIERHGGQIWLESVPGRGSTFFFTLAPPR
ncbi:Phytochrome-like protein cph1 [Thiorhodovibrio winogradskyi]|uniref:histidine kinase n=1 Tax=Thiorhodovibrio winogradskyi TaxID=77007 RepID=A0ABZ0SB54_9GAMM|nr:ATP-binding protein [Thiorhodovibrio winogradskyi]